MDRTATRNNSDVLPVEVNSKSAWQILADSVPKSEHDEIKRIIGEDLIDEAETLHTEVVALLEIWKDYREAIETESATPKQPELIAIPEPALVRENLKQEIKFFLDSLKAKGANIKRSTQKTGATAIIDYVLESGRPNSNPLSSRRPSTPRFEGNRPASAPRANDLESEVEGLEDKLSVFNFDLVADRIRTAMRSECDSLLNDAEFLQQCLEGEHDYRWSLIPQKKERAPSIGELRSFRSQLETKYFASASPKRPPSGSGAKIRRPSNSTLPHKPLPRVLPPPSSPHRSSPRRLPPPQTASPHKPSTRRLPLPQTACSAPAPHKPMGSPHRPIGSRKNSTGGEHSVEGVAPRKPRRASGVKMVMDADVSAISPRPPPPRKVFGRPSQLNNSKSPLITS